MSNEKDPNKSRKFWQDVEYKFNDRYVDGLTALNRSREGTIDETLWPFPDREQAQSDHEGLTPRQERRGFHGFLFRGPILRQRMKGKRTRAGQVFLNTPISFLLPGA
jgi:hypothetical protein